MIKENRYIQLRDGVKLHSQIKEVGGSVWVVVTHGIGEHLGRHNYMLSLFNNHFNLLQYDLRGHGKSEGKRAYIKNFMTYVEDLGEVLSYLQKTFKGDRIVLFGHSMGALITAGYLQHYSSHIISPERVFLSAPPVAIPGILGGGLRLFPMVTANLCKVPFSLPISGTVNLHKLSHDSLVPQNYKMDELNCLKLHTQLLLSLVDFSNKVFSRPLGVKCPVACAIGSKDEIVSLPAVLDYFSKWEKDAQLMVIEGAYHEMHNEIGKFRDQYFQFLVKFITQSVFSSEG